MPYEVTLFDQYIARNGVAAYQIRKHDRSLRNEDGNILIDIYYQRALLTDDKPKYQNINRSIEEDCQRFFTSEEYYSQYLSGASADNVFFHTAKSKVTHNGDIHHQTRQPGQPLQHLAGNADAVRRRPCGAAENIPAQFPPPVRLCFTLI